MLKRGIGGGIAAFASVFGILAWLAAAQPTGAAADQYMIGFDMTPGSSASTEAIDIDPCVSVDRGDSFAVDVFVTNVPSLTAFEFRVDFDPQRLSLDSASYEYMLTQSGNSLFPIDPQEEKPGRWFLGAGGPGSKASGSGTLARLQMTALSNGSSNLTIAASPTVVGPRITGTAGAAVGDSSGDGIWDGKLTSGTVKIGSSCGAATPIATPKPPTPTRTPRPGEVTPTPQPSGGSGGGNGAGGATDDPGEGSNPAASGDAGNPTGEPIVGNQQSPGAGPEETDAPAVVGRGDDSTDDGAQPGDNVSKDGGGSGVLLIAAGVLAILALVAGGTLLALKRYKF